MCVRSLAFQVLLTGVMEGTLSRRLISIASGSSAGEAFPSASPNSVMRADLFAVAGVSRRGPDGSRPAMHSQDEVLVVA
jgi:hypothetical protein